VDPHIDLPRRDAPRDWDANTYDRISGPMANWGANVLGRLALVGDETVLDAGCGSGRVTDRLAERLPDGHVIALDGSPAMLVAARERLARFGSRIEYVEADLAKPLPLGDAAVDAVLSTAAFHWIGDHPALFRHLARVVRPGGQLVAQCGGRGNIASVIRAIAAAGDGWAGPWTMAGPEETRLRLEAAGFTNVETWLHDEPTQLEPGEPLREYLRTVILGAHLERLPADRRDAFVDAVAAGLPDAVIDYVRLNIVATRGRSADGA
jgi:trans-aconitate 2-methyltransferase